MGNVRILDLKKALFYYFFSWRMVLLCVALCVALAVGLTCLRPASTQSDAMSSADDNVLAEQRTKFTSENVEAKRLAAEITKLEGEYLLLENELSKSLFLQIDPERRVNKSFDLRFTFFVVDFLDEAEKIRTNQMLCLHYLKYLSDDRYMNYLATSGLLKFDPATLTALIDITLKEDGYLEFVVTGPEEVIIDQLIKSTKNYLELIVRPDIDLLATHFLTFSEMTKEVVKDPTVTLLRNKIESEILIIKDKIAVLNQMIDTAFEESQKPSEIEISSLQKQSRSSLQKNIILGFIAGLFVSVLITVIRYRRVILRTDVVTVAKNHNISHLGVVPYLSEKAKRRRKKFGRLIDGFVIRLFSIAYDPKDASNQADYVAQLLRGMVAVCDDKNDSKLTINILVPNVQGDASVGAILEYIREALEQDRICQKVNLIEGGNLEHDPSTIEAARESAGLMLLSKPYDKSGTLENSIQRSVDLSKEIAGILEMDERW